MTNPSERELRHALESLDEDTDSYDIPPLPILLSADEIQAVPDRPGLVCLDGVVWQKPDTDCVKLPIDDEPV